jgi:hypothetical protein
MGKMCSLCCQGLVFNVFGVVLVISIVQLRCTVYVLWWLVSDISGVVLIITGF